MKFIFTPSPPSWDNIPPYGLFFLEGIPKDIVFLTLTLGWKTEKRPSGPTELDLEAGNLVQNLQIFNNFLDLINFNRYVKNHSTIQNI